MVFQNVFNKLNGLGLKSRLGFVVKAQNTIISAAFVLAVSSGLTAILGLFKGRLLTSYFGVSDALGIFYTADKIPNLVYSVLVVGALSTVFIPIFTELLTKDKKEAFETATSIIIVGTISFLILGSLVAIFAPFIIKILSVGKFTQAQIILGANLMRIMILAQLILVISSFVTSVLQSFKYFIVPAFAPVLYNLGMIIGIIFLSKRFGIYGPALGVIIGATMHLVIQLPLLRRVDFKFITKISFENKKMKEMFSLMPPRILSVVFSQVVATINNSLAILVSTSSVVLLKFASQLQFFPVHLFGASIAAAALPVLSENTNGNNEKFKKIFLTTLHQTLFLVMPASVMLLILRIPIVRLVFGVSNFPWEATVKTSYTLAFFSLSIFAQAVVYLLTRAFYALKDTFTPVKVMLITMVINVGLSIFFVLYLKLGVWAIALSYSITSILDMTALMILLSKKLGGFSAKKILVPFTKISWATVLMGVSLYVPLKLLDELVFDTTRTINLLFLTVIAGTLGMISYLFFTWMFKVEEIELFYKLLRRLNIRGFSKLGVFGNLQPEVVSEQREGI